MKLFKKKEKLLENDSAAALRMRNANEPATENYQEDNLKDIFMASQQGAGGYETSDQARADAIAMLSDNSAKRLSILSDLSARQIAIISGMDSIDQWLRDNKVDTLLMKGYAARVIMYSLSMNRKARAEIVDVVKPEPGAEAPGGLMQRIRNRLVM